MNDWEGKLKEGGSIVAIKAGKSKLFWKSADTSKYCAATLFSNCAQS